jgi:hypothetical protein
MTIATVNGIPRIVWGDNSSHDAQSLLAFEAKTPHAEDEKSATSGAKDFLREFLADGPMQAAEVEKNARENFIKISTLRRAKDSLDIRSYRSGGFGERGAWYWELRKGKMSN